MANRQNIPGMRGKQGSKGFSTMPELIKTFNMKNTKPGGKVRVV
jgi:hypothetical protein